MEEMDIGMFITLVSYFKFFSLQYNVPSPPSMPKPYFVSPSFIVELFHLWAPLLMDVVILVLFYWTY